MTVKISILAFVAQFAFGVDGGKDTPIMDGWLSQYAEAPTNATIEYRQSVGDIPDLAGYDGVIAVKDCKHIGRKGLLWVRDRWHRVIVFDCLGRNVGDWMTEKNIIAEMGYHLTERLGLVGSGGVWGRLILL